jgi:NADH-quinone oxidoreductase subunit J
VFQALAFYLFAAVTIVSGVLVILSKNPVHSVLWLILAFFNSAGLFVLMGAEFLAMILVIVYVGAVAVLFLFVVMMLDINFEELRKGFAAHLPTGLLVAGIILAQLIVLGGGWIMAPEADQMIRAPVPTAEAVAAGVTNTHAIGLILYTDYFYVFQASGMVLLVAMIGAIVLTHRQRAGVKRQNIAAQVARTPEGAIATVKVKTGEGVE